MADSVIDGTDKGKRVFHSLEALLNTNCIRYRYILLSTLYSHVKSLDDLNVITRMLYLELTRWRFRNVPHEFDLERQAKRSIWMHLVYCAE